MNKKTTVGDVARIFPNATIEENGGVISLPLHTDSPSLRLVVPEVLPIGVNAMGMLPGDFHSASISPVCQDLGTDFPIWIAAGSYHEDDEKDPEFHFEDWLTAEKLLVVSRWELIPPMQTAAGRDSPFALNYEAATLMRIKPSDMLGLNPVLPHVPVEVAPEFSEKTGLDFWVIGRTEFYALERQLLSDNLRQAIQIGEREHYNDTTRIVCRQTLEKLAADIDADPRLEGWKLECGDASAKFTSKDRRGTAREVTIFYTPAYVVGTQRCVEQGRDGTLLF